MRFLPARALVAFLALAVSLFLATSVRADLVWTKQTGWRIEGKSGAALLIGLNPSTLRGRLRKLGISKPS